MANWLERTELLVGEEALVKLASSHVLICGLGGVGSYAAEFIARAGVGKMTIMDGDVFDETNINRLLVFQKLKFWPHAFETSIRVLS
jgi:tRNA A37 threonylcarbamoyladenosine dehydratase